MTASTKTTIKSYFQTNDKPTQSNFDDFIDSCLFTAEASAQSINALNVIGIVSAAGANITTVSAVTLNAATVNAPTVNGTTANFTTVSAATVNPQNITGTITNNNATAGSVGEYITASAASVPLSNGVIAIIAQIPVQPGDYDVNGAVGFLAAVGTNVIAVTGGISQNPAAIPAYNQGSVFQLFGTFPAGVSLCQACSPTRFTTAVSANIYLLAQASFNTSTCAGAGRIIARRRR